MVEQAQTGLESVTPGLTTCRSWTVEILLTTAATLVASLLIYLTLFDGNGTIY